MMRPSDLGLGALEFLVDLIIVINEVRITSERKTCGPNGWDMVGYVVNPSNSQRARNQPRMCMATVHPGVSGHWEPKFP